MIDARAVKDALRERVVDLAAFLFPNGTREGAHWCVGDVTGAPGKSLKICISGDKAGLWGDFAESGKHSRSLLDLWMHARQVDFKTALREAAQWTGHSLHGANGAAPPRARAAATRENLDEAPLNWGECVDAFTNKDALRLELQRGYSRALCSFLKQNGLVGMYKGCFAFPVHDRGGNVVAAHYRAKNGKDWFYYPEGGKTRPLVIGELTAGDPVHVFESQWDAFAFMDKSGEHTGIIITRGATNGALVAGTIPQGSTVYAWKQNDETNGKLIKAEKWLKDLLANTRAKVLWAKTPEQHKDLNDWTRAGATADDLFGAMMNAAAVISRSTDLWTSPSAPIRNSIKRQPLTIRTIGEILEMSFDDKELVLPNGYLAQGERTAVCGMGGVGKSRLIMQLALCCRTGREFLGWETRGRKMAWLFLQTENSCRRLKHDLERMLSAFLPDEQEAIKAGIFFHTLEADDDGFLMLDAENCERIANAITAVGANIVVFDPLRDFGSDDLNSDRFMTETLREIGRITKRGNPKRIPLIIHHAGTGKAGIQKATGFDRSSFGRNSKVLFSWTRAQINISPGSPDDNSMIVISSGKCSNAREFGPFAAELDDETMLYRVKGDFDFDAWLQSLEAPHGGIEKLHVETILELLPATGSVPKADVIERLRDKRIGERRSRPFIAEHFAPAGPIHEWRIKRSGRRDAIHLSRHPQTDSES